MLPPLARRLLLSVATLGCLASQVPGQQLLAWGNDHQDQVSQAPSATDLVFVAGSESQAFALRSDGSILAWGSDPWFGIITGAPTGTGFLEVDGGLWHAIALRGDGSIAVWGNDSFGQVSGAPVGPGHLAVSAGGKSSVALRSDGSIAVWGSDSFGQISNAPSGTGFVQISASRSFLCALRSDGTIHSWGSDDVFSQVTDSPTGAGFLQVQAGFNHGVALRADGSIVSWGQDSGGVVTNTPTGTGFVQVAAGSGYSLALQADGSVTAWGSDVDGVVSSAPTEAYFTYLAGGVNAAYALYVPDCNGNGVPDYEDISTGVSVDCNGNLVPDRCEIADDPQVDIDGDGILDECLTPALTADVYESHVLVAQTGQNLELLSPRSGDIYVMLGTLSGTQPGFTFGGFTVPLNVDAYFVHTLLRPEALPFALLNSSGIMAPSSSGPGGEATAEFIALHHFNPAFIGLTFHHAFVTLDAATGSINFVSNAVPMYLVP